jgi:hypothetical protein
VIQVVRVRWTVWRPWYERIARELELDPVSDAEAARVLNALLPDPELDGLRGLISGRPCVVFGAGPSLENDIVGLSLRGFLNAVVIAADGATSALLPYRAPDVVVTDLDGDTRDLLRAWRSGAWLVVHAHGDNRSELAGIGSEIRGGPRVLGTTQLRPFGKLFNFGGFTDGDRAAFMAHELGASKIYLAGMDLGPRIGRYSGSKNPRRTRAKLRICAELLGWLARDLGAKLVNLTSGGRPIPGVPSEPL